MKITSIKELRQVIQLCRRSGVMSIEIDNVKMILTPVQPKAKSHLNAHITDPMAFAGVPSYSPIQAQESQDEAITSFKHDPEMLTDEQALMWSSKSEPA